jgi:hypothetical protein
MKFFIGPVTKNTIDTVIQYSLDYNTEFVFIPSRRQIEYNGGYVNNFTTKEFTEYVKSKSNILIERDHGGPGQGKLDDDGFESITEDSKYLDIIHIDPWKKYPEFENALDWTIKLISHCYSLNNNLIYEIGTEEGIRPIEADELDSFVKQVKAKLLPELFERIKYLVIQCGTKLLEQSNIGTYDSEKLKRMLVVCNKYNLIAKEHNGDWISNNTVKEKEEQGLTCINIAPEFGEIESSVIIEKFKENPEDFDAFFKICYESNTWKKWVSPNFNPFDKQKLIKICGHYNFSHHTFIELKKKYENIDNDICKAIKYRLMQLCGIYTIRNKCIICKSNNLTTYFNNDFETPCSFSLFDSIQTSITIPYNILSCLKCETIQTKYLGNLNVIYNNNHVDSFGQTKNDMNIIFSDFVTKDDINNTGIIEIGSCNDNLAKLLLKKKQIPYIIVEADYKGEPNDDIQIINSFIENVDFTILNGNSLILSHIFEHLYEPIQFLDSIRKSNKISYIYINHPDFEYYCKHNVYNILNIEHIYYFEKQMLINLLKSYGFVLDNEYNYKNHSIFLKFVKSDIHYNLEIINKNSIKDTHEYFNNIHTKINILNNIISDKNKKFYIWPASAHTVTLFVNGLNYNNLSGILDNSPNKIGKILYKYNLTCFSLDDMLHTDNYIILGGGGNYLNEVITSRDNIIHFVDL